MTTTASATRAADSLSITGVTGLAWPLSLFAEWEQPVVTSAASLIFQIDANTNNDRAYAYYSSGNVPDLGITAASASQADITIGSAMTAGQINKLAGRAAANNAQAARNGALGSADTSVTVPATPTNIRFGMHVSGSQGFIYLRHAALFSRALSDAELTALTL